MAAGRARHVAVITAYRGRRPRMWKTCGRNVEGLCIDCWSRSILHQSSNENVTSLLFGAASHVASLALGLREAENHTSREHRSRAPKEVRERRPLPGDYQRPDLRDRGLGRRT